MQIDVLGPVRVTPPCASSGVMLAKERALLAVLALNVGHPVGLSELRAALWGDGPPRTATKSLQNHVVRLRRCLGPDAIETCAEGYRLAVPPVAVDAFRMRSAVQACTAVAAERGSVSRRRELAQAEALWRGEPLTDLAETPERQEQVDRLRESWLLVRDARIRADLDLGGHAAVVDELQRLVAEDPLREHLSELLLLALYRCGRQVDALQAYRRVQEHLNEEWGVDPSPELQRLQWQILRQDPQLDLHPPPPPMSVPAPLTAFVGRAGQVDQVVEALAADRLVTLHGPAGVGKSRLAMEVSRALRARFPDGVWWVDLTVATDGDTALRRLVESLDVVASPGMTLDQALANHLTRRELLLVLDNCEHVATDLGSMVRALLERAPGVRVLATSRTYLRVSGESPCEVPPLATPPPTASPAEVLASDAVVLFQHRRGRQLSDAAPTTVTDVGRLCRMLDGLPLALELVAAQARRLTVHELNERLGEHVVAADRQTARIRHHDNLSKAIDWSYSLLDPVCQRLFDRLAVFPADFDQHAVATIADGLSGMAAGDPQRCLAAMVDHSLVEAQPVGDTSRYRLLFVMRQFASAQLASRGETETAWQSFTRHYRDFAIEARRGLNGDHSGTWQKRVTRELASIRSALDWSVQHESAERALGFVPAVGRTTWAMPSGMAGDLTQLRAVVQRAEAAGADTDQLAWAWQELVTPAYLCGDTPFALHACDRAEALFDQVEDRAGLAAVCWRRGATHLLATGDLEQAERAFRQGQHIGRAIEAAVPEAWCCAHLAQLHCFAGTVSRETHEAFARAVAIADPADSQLRTHLMMDRAALCYASGNDEQCIQQARACEEYAREHRHAAYEQAVQAFRATALLRSGQFETARSVALRASQLALDTDNTVQLGLSLRVLAAVAEHDREYARAAWLWGASTVRAPQWPVFAPLYTFPAARGRLRDRFDVEASYGMSANDSEACAHAID